MLLFIIAIILGLVSLVLLAIDPIIGIIGLIFCALIVLYNRNRQKAALEQQRHEEVLNAMKNK